MTLPSIDRFYKAKYHRENYNCLHFVGDVWQDQVGGDIRAALMAFNEPRQRQQARRAVRRAFVERPRPVSPCVVIMQRPKATPHVGIYLRGRVFHLHERGAEFQPVVVASRGFKTVRFYQCKQ